MENCGNQRKNVSGNEWKSGEIMGLFFSLTAKKHSIYACEDLLNRQKTMKTIDKMVSVCYNS